MKFNFPQQIRACGWSEEIDLGYADGPTAIDKKANIAALLQLRCLCLGIGPVMVEATITPYVQPVHPGDKPVRASSISIAVPAVPPAGSGYNPAYGIISKGTGYQTSDFNADFGSTVYYMTAQTNLSGTPVYHRNFWIAGLPDVSDDSGTPLITQPFVQTAVTNYIAALKNSGNALAAKNACSIRSIDRSGANPLKQCTAWNITPNTYTVPGHGFAFNQPIIALGMKTAVGGTCPRGVYLVGPPIDANTISLQGALPPTAPLKTGAFRPAIVAFNQIAEVTGKGFTKRNKGRPSGLSVGRRSTPKINPA